MGAYLQSTCPIESPSFSPPPSPLIPPPLLPPPLRPPPLLPPPLLPPPLIPPPTYTLTHSNRVAIFNSCMSTGGITLDQCQEACARTACVAFVYAASYFCRVSKDTVGSDCPAALSTIERSSSQWNAFNSDYTPLSTCPTNSVTLSGFNIYCKDA